MTARPPGRILGATGFRRIEPLDSHEGLRSLYQRYGAVYRPGATIVRQGDPGGQLFVVLQGTMSVAVAEGGGEPREVRTIGPGELFGVTSCFTGLPHSATMRTRSDARVLCFGRDAVGELIETSPAFAMVVIAALVDRLRAATERNARMSQPVRS